MLTTWRRVCGTWILGINADPLGRVRDLVVNPDTGEIPALWINTPNGMKLLAISEIQRWHHEEIYIDSPATLISAEEFPRLNHVLDAEVPIINSTVFEILKAPQKIGTCNNFTFNTRSPRLLSIETKKSWMFWEPKRIIPWKKIEEINSQGIFVTSTLLTERSEASQNTEILNKALPEAKTSQSFRKN